MWYIFHSVSLFSTSRVICHHIPSTPILNVKNWDWNLMSLVSACKWKNLQHQQLGYILLWYNQWKSYPGIIAAFTEWSKTVPTCFGFALPRLKNSCDFFIQSEVKTHQLWLARTRFPTLYVSFMYLLYVLIGSLFWLDCLCNLWWLAKVITLVLQHLIEKCSHEPYDPNSMGHQ